MNWIGVSTDVVDDTYRQADERVDDATADGVIAAIDWVRRGGPGPITGRPGPPSKAEAQVEMWSAMAVALPSDLPPPPLQPYSAELGVEYLPPSDEVDATWATAVFRTLSWLVGRGTPPLTRP